MKSPCLFAPWIGHMHRPTRDPDMPGTGDVSGASLLRNPARDQVIVIEQADSAQEPGLQAVDFVAWALAQQSNGVTEWGKILAGRIVAFEVISGNKTAALPGGR